MLRTYVGQELGEPILVGQIRRGDVHSAKTALMLVDLRDFTALSDEPTPAIGQFDLRGLPASRNFLASDSWLGICRFASWRRVGYRERPVIPDSSVGRASDC